MIKIKGYHKNKNIGLTPTAFICQHLTLKQEPVADDGWLFVFALASKLFVSFTFCDQSYPLLNTEMDSFMKYYFTTFMEKLVCAGLYTVNFITLLSLYLGKTRC